MILDVPQLTQLEVGDRCYLIREPWAHGTVAVVEENRFFVMVEWDHLPDAAPNFQWGNKVDRL